MPERVCHDPDRPLTDADWNELQIPVAMAFFFVNSALGRVVAGYPSPGGATECELDLRPGTGSPPRTRCSGRWRRTSRRSSSTAPSSGNEVFLIPIDECYSLVGGLRMRWQGFDGGAEARAALAAFLDGLRQRAVALAPGER